MKLTPNDDRTFVFSSRKEQICFVPKCLSLRDTYATSGKGHMFHCQHLMEEPVQHLYAARFASKDIEEFTPDKEIQRVMENIQDIFLPTVVKVSDTLLEVFPPHPTR